jgi:hypothetical protein
MNTSFRTLTVTVLLGSVLAVGSAPAWAQSTSTNKPATTSTTKSSTKKSSAEKKDSTKDSAATATKKAHPFHGKLASVDKVNKTITLGKSTYQITSETKIKKGDKPAMLEDGVVGEDVSGYVKPAEDGKMVATTVTFGPKSTADKAASTTTSSDKKKSKDAPTTTK